MRENKCVPFIRDVSAGWTGRNLDGDDRIFAGGGNDIVFADSGDDFVDGGDGADYIEGNCGADTIYGGVGDDIINGKGVMTDLYITPDGGDFLYGGTSNDKSSRLRSEPSGVAH